MAYVPNATTVTEPIESRSVESAALEFRTLKEYVVDLAAQVATEDAKDLRVPESTVNPIPAVTGRAGKVLGFDSSGQPIAVAVAGTEDPSLRADLAALSGSSLIGYKASGTGAVATTVKDALDESQSVFRFMTAEQIAEVKNRTEAIDVTAAVQAAFDACTGKKLYLPPGVYKVSSLALNNVKLVGDGRGKTVLKGTSGSYITVSNGVSAEGITFDTWQVALVLPSSMSGVSVNSCEFVACGKSISDRTSESGLINTGITLSDFTYTNNIDRNGQRGPTLLCLVQGAKIVSNFAHDMTGVENVWAYCIGAEAGTNVHYDSYGIVIYGNVIQNITTTGVDKETHGIFCFGKQAIISNNVVRNVKSLNASTVFQVEGIYCKVGNLQIVGNYLYDAGSNQGAITSKSKYSGRVRISENTIVYDAVSIATGDGCVGVFASEIEYLEISNNTVSGANTPYRTGTNVADGVPKQIIVRDNSATGDMIAGIFLPVATEIVVDGNVLNQTVLSSTKTRYGVFYSATTGNADSIVVQGNTFTGFDRAVQAAAAGSTISTMRLIDNVVRNNVSSGADRGFSINVTPAFIEMRGNDLRNTSAKTVITLPSPENRLIEANAGYSTLIGSATYDPPSLASGASQNTTITVTGATAGDMVSATFSNPLSGVTLTAWVSSSNTVTCMFTNNSAGTVDLSSGTIRVLVNKF